jgi:hypothetical protein
VKGHVKLGTSVADLREYILTDPNGLGMQLTNQMAAKLGQGAGKYDDLQNWSAWVQDNWSAGAGTVDAEGGGFLFGSVDSRVPRQLILPPAIGITTRGARDDLYWVTPHDLTSSGVSITLLSSGEQTIFSVKARHTAAVACYLWIYAQIPSGSTVSVAVYNSTPSLLYTSTTTTTVREPGHHWHRLTIGAVTSGTTYQLRISVNGAWQVFVTDETATPFFSFQYSTTNNYSEINKVIRFNEALYGIHPNGLFKFNTSTKLWAAVSGSPTVLTDCIVFNNKLYLGVESTFGNFYTMTTGESFTAASLTGEHFHKWNGYLYRVVGDSFYYTADGTTWEGPFLAEPNEDILAMSGMGNDMYFANLNGLYRLAPGDTIFGVVQWGKRAGTIGNDQADVATEAYSTNQGQVGMVNWQGDLYIAVDGQIMRYTPNGQITEIWLKDSGDLPQSYVGKIDCLAVMNNYLVACVSSATETSCWAWSRQGWHCLAMLPQWAPYTYSMQYDRTLGRLWICGFYFCMYISISDYAQNPYTLSTSVYMPSAWMESHWFDGSLFEIKKDFESVYVTGDTIGSNDGGNTEIDVYWKDDDSIDWELLGVVDTGREEIRWSSAATRPNSRQIKLALRLRTESVFVTPKVEAIRVKYMSMLLDRYRWTLPIAVSANQEMLDNTLNSYTVAQQVTHIHSLINSVAPVWFEDVDGTQYEVKVMGASRSVRDFEYRNPSTAKVYKLVYNLVVEQVVSNINT